jgi:hypothetical protein
MAGVIEHRSNNVFNATGRALTRALGRIKRTIIMKEQTKLMPRVASSFLLASFIGQSAAAEQPADPCEVGVPVALDGTLFTESQFGPPGWGEDPKHDSKWQMVALKLSAAATTSISPVLKKCLTEPADTTQVQLRLETVNAAWWKPFEGKHVTATGTLYFTDTAPTAVLPVQFELSAIPKL